MANYISHFDYKFCFEEKSIFAVHLRAFHIVSIWLKLTFGIVPKNRSLQASVYRHHFIFYYLWSAMKVHSTVWWAECAKRERLSSRKREKSSVFPQRNLLFRIYLSCSYYLNTQLLSSFLATIRNTYIPILFFKWFNSERKFVYNLYLVKVKWKWQEEL